MAQRTVHYKGTDYAVAYDLINPKGVPAVLFLHGWGSNRAIMRQAFETPFLKTAQLYVDMPGFGASPSDSVLDSNDYAAIMALFLDAVGFKPTIIVGHSFGGKIATLLNPEHLVLVSSAGIVPPKPFKVKSKIVVFKLFKHLGLGRFYRLFATKDVQGMPKNMYETLKRVVNEDFTDTFAAFKGKATLFWGEADTATPLACGRKIAELISQARFYPLSGDHFFFLQHGREIAEHILEGVTEA